MGLKVATHLVNGVQRIDPEVMGVLVEFGTHRQFCEECENATAGKGLGICSLGDKILQRIVGHPDVEFFEEGPKKT